MDRSRVRGMTAAIAAISIFAFGFSLILPLLALLMERMGFSGLQIGLVNGASAFAIAGGGIILPLILRRMDVPTMIVIGIVVMAATLCLFLVYPSFWTWMFLRALMGFAAAAIFFGSEIWIVSSAPKDKRGLMIGVYGLFLSLGFLAGPLLLKIVGTEGWTPFLAGGALALLGAIPVLWARRDGPDTGEEEGAPPTTLMDILNFFRTDPAVLWAVTLFGCIEFGAMALIPVWSVRVGMDEQAALTLVALLAAGNVVMQVPMGWLGDKLDRRKLLTFCAAFSVLSAIGAPYIADTTWPLYILTAIWGGIVVGLYTFALNELGSRYSGAEFAKGNGAFMSAYGFGALVAPPLLGLAMDWIPPHGMFHLLAVAAGAYLALLLIRRPKR